MICQFFHCQTFTLVNYTVRGRESCLKVGGQTVETDSWMDYFNDQLDKRTRT